MCYQLDIIMYGLKFIARKRVTAAWSGSEISRCYSSPCNPQFKMLLPHCNDVTGDRKQFVTTHK